MSAAGAAAASVAGVRITNPERILFDELGLTKAALARYYESVAEWLLAELRERPLSLVRLEDLGLESFLKTSGGKGREFPRRQRGAAHERPAPRSVEGAPPHFAEPDPRHETQTGTHPMIERKAHVPTPEPPQPPRPPAPDNPTDPQPPKPVPPIDVPPSPSDEPPPIGDPVKPRQNPPVKDPPPDEKPNPPRY